MTNDKKFTNKLILDLLQKYKKIWALGASFALLDWDRNVYMPSGAADMRAEIEAQMDALSHMLLTDKEFVALVNTANDKQDDFNKYEKGVVRELKRLVDKENKLPEEFVKKMAKTTSKAFMVWQKAKKQNDFKLFEPYLKQIVELSKQKAEYLGYNGSAYNALLDNFEPDLNTKDLDEYFGQIIPALKDILNKIQNKPGYKAESDLEKLKYSKDKVKEINYKILEYLQFNKDLARMDVSAHPFTTEIGGSTDVRITTWYHNADFRRSISATIHEWGHALHALGAHPDFMFTPIGKLNSFAVGESQSRFMENIVGRDPEFIKLWLQDFKALGKDFNKYELQDYVHYFNMVRPDLIRVEADEVTYHFHIYIRYLIEKELIEGSIDVADVPEVWNLKFQELLGISVPDASHGALQDVHWSLGYIGYFPTYSMGTFMAMQIAYYMQKDLEQDISKLVKTKQGMAKIIKYLHDKVHVHGALYTPKELMKKSFGKYLDPQAGLEYLRGKYL